MESDPQLRSVSSERVMAKDAKKQQQAAIRALEENWRAEKESARVYRELGEAGWTKREKRFS